MPERGTKRWRQAAILEVTTYALLIGGFLWSYVRYFHAPASVILPHIMTIGAILLPYPLLRTLSWKFMPPGWLRTLVVTLLAAGPFALLTAWYALVLLGLDAWGRVTTWPLIRTYVVQAPYLIDVLGIPIWLPVSIAAVGLVGLAALVRYSAVAHDWTRSLAALASRTGTIVICTFGLMISPLCLHALLVQHPWDPNEPIALGFAHKKYTGLQSHAVEGSRTLDAREHAARETYAPAKTHPQRNVIVIVGDALRAGHMSALGYSRRTTPHLQRRILTHNHLVARSMRSACAESSCGLMALAASRPVAELTSHPLTLQEVLRRNGYQAHFILSGDHTNFYGLDALYGELDSFFDGSQQTRRYINDDQLVLDQINGLPRATPGQPVMFQFHLMSTHGLGMRDMTLSPFAPWSNYYAWPGPSPRRPPTFSDTAHGVNYYDNGMLRFDHVAEIIISTLQEKGYLEEAVVVITGDHGEMLGEKGYFSHQHGLSEAVLDIPFILLRFGYQSTTAPEHPWNGQIDIAPTILHELGIPAPEIWEGRALQEPWLPRRIQLQQRLDFGIYHIDETGEVWKYVRNAESGFESVTAPAIDPLGGQDILSRVPTALLNEWRMKSGTALLNTVEVAEPPQDSQ